ncbi:4'-phosphopantetheinyl transferase superfamily protein [Pelomyxa schiedti]|nr:4'-phosphopantetheinyl transferase superfamily protein [Pelomyxa schiedti]
MLPRLCALTSSEHLPLRLPASVLLISRNQSRMSQTTAAAASGGGIHNEADYGSVRWAFEFGSWTPSPGEWSLALSHIEPVEVTRIGRFKRPLGGGLSLVGKDNPDAKSAAVGRLLMRKLVSELLGIPFDGVDLQRTKEGKPYLSTAQRATYADSKFPNFNFNVSHHGNWVVLASEPHDLVGVDVMKSEHPRGSETVREFFQTMSNTMTPHEWAQIKQGPLKQQLDSFYTFWCLKESYIKAVGIGLGFDLQRASFTLLSDEAQAECTGTGTPHSPDDCFDDDYFFYGGSEDDEEALLRSSSGEFGARKPRRAAGERHRATLKIDGVEQISWRFDVEWLDPVHMTAVARGPPAAAGGSGFGATLRGGLGDTTATRFSSGRGYDRPGFTRMVGLPDLLPHSP